MTNHWCSLFSIWIVTLSLMRSFFVLLGRLEDNIHHVLWWHVATDKDDRWVGPNVSTTQLLYYLLSSFLSSHMPLVSMSSAEQLAIYPWKWLNLSSSLKSFSKSSGFLGKQHCLRVYLPPGEPRSFSEIESIAAAVVKFRLKTWK